ncbi:MAG TPA: methyltransferase domain-containing protein [bacterium]|nr:methyltransferase domain-containing protein [bacterium]
MNILFYIILVLVFLFFAIFIALFSVFTLDSVLRGHDLPTRKRAIRYLVKIISKHKPDATTFYDLGCGRGTVVLTLKKKLPSLEIYGIDNNAVRIFFAKLKTVLLRREVNLKKQDIFQTDLRNADIIYTYLWYDLMPPLEKKLQKELKHGAIIITNTSNFPTWKPVKIYVTYPKNPDFEKLFIYVKT